MVKTPKASHSRRHREPVTIDLQADAVPAAAAGADDAAPDAAVADSGAGDALRHAPPAETASTFGMLHDDAPDSLHSGAEDNVRAEAAMKPDEQPSSTGGWGSAAEPGAAGFGRRPAETPSAPATPAPRSRGGASAIAGGLVGAVLAVGGAWLLQYAGMLPSPSQGPDATAEIAALRSEIDALKSAAPPVPAPDPSLQAAVDELRSSYASLEQAVKSAGSGEDTQAMEERLKALETSIASLSQSAPDPAEIGALDDKVAAADTQAQAAGEAAASAGQKVAAMEEAVAALTAKVDAQASQPKIALAIATSALKSALERGAPFSAELATLAAITPAAPQLDALRKLADAGVPTRAAIEAEVDEAAAAMIAAATPVDVNAGYMDRLLSSARSLVTIRPTGKVEGTGVPEIVARMEAAVKDGDYASALTEYGTLPEAPKAAGADFAAKLRARLDAETLVDQAVAGAMQAG